MHIHCVYMPIDGSTARTLDTAGLEKKLYHNDNTADDKMYFSKHLQIAC